MNDVDISWNLRSRFFVQLADALKYLHCHDSSRVYIHGDVKPQNILLSKNLTVKLADFGAAIIERVTGTNISMCEEQNFQHTPLYTAPEYLKHPTMNKTTAMDVYR